MKKEEKESRFGDLVIISIAIFIVNTIVATGGSCPCNRECCDLIWQINKWIYFGCFIFWASYGVYRLILLCKEWKNRPNKTRRKGQFKKRFT